MSTFYRILSLQVVRLPAGTSVAWYTQPVALLGRFRFCGRSQHMLYISRIASPQALSSDELPPPRLFPEEDRLNLGHYHLRRVVSPQVIAGCFQVVASVLTSHFYS